MVNDITADVWAVITFHETKQAEGIRYQVSLTEAETPSRKTIQLRLRNVLVRSQREIYKFQRTDFE